MDKVAEAQESTTKTAIIVGLITIAVGSLLLWCSSWTEENGYLKSASVLRELGAFALVSVVLALWWEVLGRRKYTDELFAKIGMTRDLSNAGITNVAMSFRDDRIQWTNYFTQSTRLDIWVAYANTWRNQHLDRLLSLLLKPDAKVRIALPNPDNAEVMGQLAVRFSQSPEDLRRTIQQSISDFRNLDPGRTKISIYLVEKVPLYTFYMFNNVAILAFYNHRTGKLPVPTVICNNEGTLYQYLTNEFADLVKEERLAN